MPYIPPQFTTHSGLHIFIKLFVVFVGDVTRLSFPDTVCCHSHEALVPKASLALTLYLYSGVFSFVELVQLSRTRTFVPTR